jgi:CrcB protein
MPMPRPARIDLVAVFVGGMVGTLARAALAEVWTHDGGGWPWSTFAVNLLAAGLLGWASVALPGRGPARPFVGTGICGALSTFSTFQLELYDLADAGHVGVAAAYLVASIAGGLAVIQLTRRWAQRTAVVQL